MHTSTLVFKMLDVSLVSSALGYYPVQKRTHLKCSHF